MPQIILQWFVDCLISLLALTGYITYYNQLLNGDKHWLNLRVDTLILGVACGLQLAMLVDPLRYKVYANLQLLMLAFPLLGSDIDRRHLLVRTLGLIGFTMLNHPGLGVFDYALATAGQLVLVALMQRFYTPLREHFTYNTLLMLALAAGYWLPRADLAWSSRVGLVATYLVISGVNFWYWLALRRADGRYSRLAHQVDFDPLTNAASFVLFRQNADAAFARARKLNQPLTVMMLDIDYFKRINDHYGHPVGDAVLIACLHRLESVLKPAGARIYRTGGEEFTVLLPARDVEAATPLAVACRKAMREEALVAGSLRIDVTISMGMDQQSAADADFDALYARVDADLYRSKARGRDTLTVAGETLWRHDRLTVSHFFAESTQPVWTLDGKTALSCGMAADYWVEAAQGWQPADKQTMALAEPLRFLQEAAGLQELACVDLTLSAAQFGEPQLLPRLSDWLAATPQVQTMRLILEDTPSPALLEAVAAGFKQAGCQLVLHPTAGSPWQACLPHLSALAVDVQQDAPALQHAVAAGAATSNTPLFARQVDAAGDWQTAQALGAVQACGKHFGAPVLPQVVARTNRDQQSDSRAQA